MALSILEMNEMADEYTQRSRRAVSKRVYKLLWHSQRDVGENKVGKRRRGERRSAVVQNSRKGSRGMVLPLTQSTSCMAFACVQDAVDARVLYEQNS